MRSPGASSRSTLSSAARPEAKARPWAAPSSDATHASSAARVGLPERAYSYPWCSPTAVWANVVDREIGATTAPVAASGGWPACTARVSNPQPSSTPRSPMVGARRQQREHVAAGEDRQRPPARQHEEGRAAVEHLDGQRQRLTHPDGRQLRAHDLL